MGLAVVVVVVVAVALLLLGALAPVSPSAGGLFGSWARQTEI